MAVLTEEQQMLRDAARDWARATTPVSALRRLRDSGSTHGFEVKHWVAMAEMGWAGVIVPEQYGGSDFGYFSLGVILEAVGRTLTASPLLSTALIGATALNLGGSTKLKEAWLPRIAEGKCVIAVAVDEGPHHNPAACALSARSNVLTGKKVFVADGMAADAFVVATRTSGAPGEMTGISLYLVASDSPGITRTPMNLIDARGAAIVSFDKTPGVLLGSRDKGWEILDPLLDRARAGLAAEMLGAASEAFDITVEYLKTRVQFGRLIGSFQALQHRAAEMLTDIETTRSSVEMCLRAIDTGEGDVRELASIAKVKAGELSKRITNEMIQMHGGIGMTDPHVAGFYLKRARVAEQLYGGVSFHRDRFAALSGY